MIYLLIKTRAILGFAHAFCQSFFPQSIKEKLDKSQLKSENHSLTGKTPRGHYENLIRAYRRIRSRSGIDLLCRDFGRTGAVPPSAPEAPRK
jgi:hypothetical protein